MNKDLLSSLLVVLVFILGALVELIRGRMVMAIIGLVLGIIFAVFTVIGYTKEKKSGVNGKAEAPADNREKRTEKKND